jgi:small neutral amino acid transporter SnatA (MarC family)
MCWADIDIHIFRIAASTVAFAIGFSVCFGSESAKSIGPKSGRPQAQTASMNDVFPALSK